MSENRKENLSVSNKQNKSKRRISILESNITQQNPVEESGICDGKSEALDLRDLMGEPCSRDEVLERIAANTVTQQQFSSFSAIDQERILAYLCGERSLQILSDRFFKHVLDPQTTPERVESLLSAIYEMPVSIMEVLPKEGMMITESSQVVMDIVVKLATEETVDIEMQRIGYLFPGERTSCYLADMIMRQYEKTRSKKGKDFSYRDMKPVNLIVIMEESSREFLRTAPQYIHKRKISYSSGVELTTLEQVTYISLDTFRKWAENKEGRDLDAWLTFFTAEEPGEIVSLVSRWPQFISMYHDIAEFRKDPEEVIGMFSEALRIMDRNTTKYMIDSLHQTIDDQNTIITDLTQTNADLTQSNADLTQSNADLTQSNADLMRELERYHALYGVITD